MFHSFGRFLFYVSSQGISLTSDQSLECYQSRNYIFCCLGDRDRSAKAIVRVPESVSLVTSLFKVELGLLCKVALQAGSKTFEPVAVG